MAINPATLADYNGQVAAPDASYPYGSAKDDAVPGDLTGTPRVASEIKDIEGLQQKLLTLAGITPSGAPDTALVSDYFNAITRLIGRNFSSVATLIADTQLIIGSLVRTEEYIAGNGKGGATYKVVAGSTGTDDGIFFMDLASGLQVQLLHNDEIQMSQCGVVGDFSADDAAKFEAIKTFVSTDKFTIAVDTGTSVQTALTLPANIHLKNIRGNLFEIDTAIVVNHLGTFAAGEWRVFSGDGDIIFSETVAFSPAVTGRVSSLYAAWWGNVLTDIGISLTRAVRSIRYRGGTIRTPAFSTVQLTSADITDTTRGIIIKGQSSGGFNFPMIDSRCTGKASLDLTKSSSVTIKDVGINGHATNTPFTALLMARDTTGASYGNHIIENFATSGEFSGGVIYNYGSEVVDMVNCQIRNAIINGKGIVHTYNNIFSATSDYQSIFVGAQSNSTFHISGGEILVTGSGDTDAVYIEGSTDLNIDKTFISNGFGRAVIYVNNSVSGSNTVQLTNIRGEVDTNKPNRGIEFSGTATCAFWKVDSVGMDVDTDWLYSPDALTLSNFHFVNNVDNNSAGINAYNVDYSYFFLGTSPYITRNTTQRSHVMGVAANVEYTANSNSSFMDLSTGTLIEMPALP